MVRIAPAANASQDASALLRLGLLNGGIETLGAAVLRPQLNPPLRPPDNYFFVGDHSAPTAEVASVNAALARSLAQLRVKRRHHK